MSRSSSPKWSRRVTIGFSMNTAFPALTAARMCS